MSAADIHTMPEADRYLTAMTRARFWKWWGESMFGGNSGQGPK